MDHIIIESLPCNINLSKFAAAVEDHEMLKDKDQALGISPSSTDLPPINYPVGSRTDGEAVTTQ